MGLFGLFGKKEDEAATIPANDAEKWVTATYAMWSESAGGRWNFIAGSPEKNKSESASMRVMLRRDWEVNNKGSLLEQVSFLTSLYAEEDCEAEDIEMGAWDLCRACQILAMGYVGGYLERAEMISESCRVGRIMQRHYHSWAELYDSYVKGYADWRIVQGGEAEKDITERKELVKRLFNSPDGPCAVAWDTALA
ncbi:MAG: DUF1266 domain-containing protein [Lachnospiraceae bacterium]|nr:DUF1266 domain-containing protein [Lachnospiraceae bacterium]